MTGIFRTAGAFREAPLGDMTAAGAVGVDRARLWVRSETPGTFTVEWWPEGREDRRGRATLEIPPDNPRDNAAGLDIPGNGEGPGLQPAARYRYRVVHGDTDRLVGEGRFETAPEGRADAPERFGIGLMSCNQPFTADGRFSDQSGRMLRAVRRCLEDHNAKYILMVGDQIYSDYPPTLSLFEPAYFDRVRPSPDRDAILDCTVGEVRKLYHRHYRHAWSHPDWRALHARFPSYPMLDDHDIVDNWGSVVAHQRPEWQSVGEGARWAYQDYQNERIFPAGRRLPAAFDYQFSWGHTATYALDLRSNRVAGEGGRLFSPEQMADFREFLENNADKSALFIVLSVPIIHLPRTLARLAARFPHSPEDFSDRWSSGAHLKDRDEFLKTVHAHQLRHPDQLLALMSGDIHIGCVHRIQWQGGGPRFYQMISSGITHAPGFIVRHASNLLIRMNHRISTVDSGLSGAVRLMKGTGLHRANPFAGINLGVVEVHTPKDGGAVRLRFYLYGHNGEAPLCAYRSPWVSAGGKP